MILPTVKRKEKNMEFFGMMTMVMTEEHISELKAVQKSIEDILSKLPLIYQGESVELVLPIKENASINQGLDAIKLGYPQAKIESYFQEGLSSIKRQISELRSMAPRLAAETAMCFENAKTFETEDGTVCFTIPTPPCLSEFF